MTAVVMHDVSVRHRGGTEALRSVSLTIAAGQRVAIVGASGSGKTTLAGALFGIVPGVTGRIRVLGQPVPAPPTAAQLLFQHPAAMLHPAMTLTQLLTETARRHARPRGAVQAIIDIVGLSHRAEALPGALSGGELRRAGVARVLLAEPSLLVADEPTTGLDADLAPDIADLLMAPGRTTLLITHDLGLAGRVCDRVLFLYDGELVDDAPSPMGLSHPQAVAMVRAAEALS